MTSFMIYGRTPSMPDFCKITGSQASLHMYWDIPALFLDLIMSTHFGINPYSMLDRFRFNL